MDGSGLCDYSEFVACVMKFSKDKALDYVKQAFRHFDTDGDGFISKKDIKATLGAKICQTEFD